MATLGARVDEAFFKRVTAAANALGMKVSGFLTAAVEEKMAAPAGNARQYSLLDTGNNVRHGAQREQIRMVMVDGAWRSLPDIATAINASDASIPSISARLRDLRKPEFGSYTVDKRQPRKGYFEYCVKGGKQ